MVTSYRLEPHSNHIGLLYLSPFSQYVLNVIFDSPLEKGCPRVDDGTVGYT